MSEQHAPAPADFPVWLAARGEDAHALVRVATPQEPAGRFEAQAQAPWVGETGIARSGADLSRITVQEVAHGRAQALRRWLHLDDGRPLAIVTTGPGGLREHTPGDLAAQLMRDPDGEEAWLTRRLADWLARRTARAPHDGESAWMTAGAAWAVHLGALGSFPPPAVLTLSLEDAGEPDEAIAEVVASTGLRVADLLDRLERPYRTRTDLIKDWNTLQPLAADVPALTQTADWLLDQIALRDAAAQQLRAVLEPDLTDHLRAAGHTPGVAGRLDEQRAAHLAQARAMVRAYTAAACSGRGEEAQSLLDAFPAPARPLTVSGPAAAWRRAFTPARDAVTALTVQRATSVEDGADSFADPELLHAQISYLTARAGQLHRLHDALGRLAFPAETPRTLPEALRPVASAQTERRLIEAFGTLERAAQALDGQISYARRHTTSGAETGLLTTARNALEHLAPTAPLDEEHIRARLQQAMARPAAPAAPAARDESHLQTLAPGTSGIHR